MNYYDGALLYEPDETKGYYHKQLRLDLFKNDLKVKTITADVVCFDITPDTISVYDLFPGGQDSPRQKGNLILKIDMPKYFERF